MLKGNEQLTGINREAVAAATRMTRISMDSAERVIALQLEFARQSLEDATKAARALAGAKDVQELLALRAKGAESAIEKLMGYSRGLYEVASDAQAEFSKFAEERMTRLQAAMAESVDQAAQSAPAGSDVAVAALKSSMAATTAAFDSFTKAARHMASFADAGVKAAGGAKGRK